MVLVKVQLNNRCADPQSAQKPDGLDPAPQQDDSHQDD
jgi:hypothetical protein